MYVAGCSCFCDNNEIFGCLDSAVLSYFSSFVCHIDAMY